MLWTVPVVAFLATFGLFGVRHPGSVKAMLTNAQGVAMVCAALLCAAIFTWASQFRPRVQTFVPLVIAAGILGAAVYAEVPFEQRSTQNEVLVAEPVVDAAPSSTVVPRTPTVPAPTPTVAALTATTAPVATATRHASAALRGINHSASGSVSAIESATGRWVVRFRDFTVQGSPEPVLYVVNEADARKPGGTNLGAFTATNGELLDVALPDGVEPGAGWTVLIWCEKFDTPIANASLQ